MRVILSENQIKKYIFKEFLREAVFKNDNYNPIADGNSVHNPYAKQTRQNVQLLHSFLKNNGTVMTNIENGKDYLVYEMAAFANIIGKRFCICQLIKDNDQFGAVYMKPFSLFRLKIR